MGGIIEAARERGQQVEGAVLAVLASMRKATIAEMVQTSGYSKDSLWRCLKRLEGAGRVVRSADGRLYSLAEQSPAVASPAGQAGDSDVIPSGPDPNALLLLRALRDAADHVNAQAATRFAERMKTERMSITQQIPEFCQLIVNLVGRQIDEIVKIQEEAQADQARARRSLEQELVAGRRTLAEEQARGKKTLEDTALLVAKFQEDIASIEQGYEDGLKSYLAWQREIEAIKASMESVVGNSFSLLPIYKRDEVKIKALANAKEMKALGDKFRSLLGK